MASNSTKYEIPTEQWAQVVFVYHYHQSPTRHPRRREVTQTQAASPAPSATPRLCRGDTVPGTFQEYCVADAAHVARIPASIPDGELGTIAPVLCAGITIL